MEPTPQRQRTGALAALEAAADAGVRVVFANPGTSEMWLVSALDALHSRRDGRPALRAILCLHETVAAGAADGFARVAHFSDSSSSSSSRDRPGPRRPCRRPLPLAAALLHLGPGLANALSALHNCRRARCRPPLLALVGDMARWHQGSGAPLEMKGPAPDLPAIEALAAMVSCAVFRAGIGSLGPGAAVRAAVRAAAGRGDGGDAGGVATVILPHDVTWLPAEKEEEGKGDEEDDGEEQASTTAAATAAAASDAFASRCAAALRRFPRGSSALILGGRALLDEPLFIPQSSEACSDATTNNRPRSLLALCGAVAAATGARLLCEPLPARVDRGAGRPQALKRLPYFPDAAARELARYRCVVLVDCPRPVASFGYDGLKGRLLPEEEDGADDEDEGEDGRGGPNEKNPTRGPVVFELDGPTDAAVAAAMRALCTRVGGDAIVPGVNCGGVFAPPSCAPPPLPPAAAVASSSASPPAAAPLTPATLCAVVAALQPPGCVLVDESLTSGGAHWPASRHCPAFSQLLLTGGAIGAGPPLSVGAAAALRLLRQEDEEEEEEEEEDKAGDSKRPARPLRVVLNLQADGSLLYSPQALWTQARERLPVVTVVCANRAYAILRLEQAKQRIPPPPAPAGGSAAATGCSGAAGCGNEDNDKDDGGDRRPPSEALTAVDRPSVDFVSLARGMGVPGSACSDAPELARLLKEAIARAESGGGPSLIQANL